MADKRVPVLAPDPDTGKLRFATVDEKDAPALVEAGGKLLTKQEALQQEQRAAYEAAPTTSKIAGAAAGLAAGPIVGNALAGTGTITEAPEVQAFNQGQASALTGGLDQVAVHQGLKAIAGKDAAAAYAKNQREIAEANPDYKTAGEVAGFAAAAYGGSGATGAVRALPGVGIGALGAGAENLAARGLGGLATRGVLGRALATGGELGARGAIEGALYGAANSVTEQDLGDTGVTADKFFAAMGHGAFYGGLGGAVLGTGGSLAKSAVSATAGSISRALGRATDAVAGANQTAADLGAKADVAAQEAKGVAASAGQDAKALAEHAAATGKQAVTNEVADVTEGALKTAREAAEVTGTKPAQEIGATRGLLADWSTEAGQKGKAYDLAWGSIGKGQGLQSTRYAKQAERYLPNGTRDVGEVLIRKRIINPEDGVIAAAKAGTPADMLPKIEAALDTTGSRLGDMTDMSTARVSGEDIAKAAHDIIAPYQSKAGHGHIAKSIVNYVDDLGEKLGLMARDEHGNLVRVADTTSVQQLLYQRKALDELVYKEAKALDPNMRVQALRDLRSKIEGVITDAMDDASGKLPGELRGEYQALKKDYVALSIAKDAAEDSAARMSKAATFGLRDTMAALGAAASGHIMAAPVMAIGGKLLRERGQAAAAVLVHRMADLGTISKVVRTLDDSIGRASQGLLSAPKRGPLPELPAGTVRQRAEAAVGRIAEAKADPQAYLDRVARETEPMSVNAPELAGALAQKATDYLAFMDAHIPSPPPPDPLDPHAKPRLTDAEASKIARYDWYWQKPQRFFDEVAHGHLTFEGIEVAQAACPSAFAELQQRTAEGLATLAMQGRKPPFAQRQKLGDLMGFAATPAQAADHVAFLQKNAMLISQQASGPAPAPPRASSPITPQRSPLDRLEASGPGRR